MLNTIFDKVICLTQGDRPDRWAQFEHECERIGLRSEKFTAIPHENKFISFCNSQYAMVKHCYQFGAVKALLLEDDAVFKPMTHITEADRWPWGLFYLGANPTGVPEKLSTHAYRLYGAWTSHAIGYTRTMMKFVIDNYKGWEVDGMYDDWLARKVHPKFLALCVKPFIAVQRPVRSDLWGNDVSYDFKAMEGKLV
jgi:hypothetical protein